MITLHYNNTTKSIQEDDSSFRYRALMGDNNITLKFSLDEAIEFPVGTYIVFQGETYTLTSPEKWSRKGNHNIEYTMVLDGTQSALGKYKFRNQQDGRLKFSMNATPSEFLSMIIANLNQTGRESGWVGVCNLQLESKTIEFNHNYISDALRSVCSAFDTEFEITAQKTIIIGKIEYNKSTPLALSYGRGNGFKPNTGRANSSDSKPIEILYVQGGERNIDLSSYGSKELHLPAGQQYTLDGKTYEVSDDGLSIHRADKEMQYGNEDSYDGSDIYPKRVGTVSSVVVVDADKHFYDFIDLTIPSNLDYNDYLIAGETMSVIFQSGMLAGKEFEISSYDHSTRKFEIVPQEIDGVVMPDASWKPIVGDTYAIFGCTLPAAYICDNDSETGAEWDLFKDAVKYLSENEDFKFTFSGELQGKWARENWATVGPKLIIGGYINFSDTQFAPNGTLIRITGIKQSLSDPYAPIIEISNSVLSAGSVSSTLKKIEQQEVKIDDVRAENIAFSKRRFRDAQETIAALEEAMIEGYSDRISPIAIQTMAMLVGDESLQFRFVNSTTSPVKVSHEFLFDTSSKIFSTTSGIIQHMTIGINNVAPQHSVSEYKFWNVSAFQSQPLTGDAAKNKYFFYIKASKSTTSATFVLSQTAIAIDGVTGYYHFLVGILNSEMDGERSFATMYGFTEVLPGRITADNITATGLLFAERAVIENAVIRMLETAEAGTGSKRIVILNNEMSMEDSGGVQRLHISGDAINTGSPSSSYPTLGNSGGGSYWGDGAQGTDSDEFLICQFSVPSNNSTVIIPRLVVDASITHQGGYGGSINDQEASLVLYKGTVVERVLASFTGAYGIADLVYNGGTFDDLDAGTYSIKYASQWRWWVDSEPNPSQQNSIAFLVKDISNASIVVTSGSSQTINIGSNGIAIHLGNNFSVIFALDNNTPLMLLQGLDSQSRAVGLKVSSAGIQINRGSGWVSL